ncbi:hypothetical protein EIP86_002232 [Pleurotus ostreatoroseus]|nr:hypothetical protein EIP86_002232 [Pleurotus ostreatoroseus]
MSRKSHWKGLRIRPHPDEDLLGTVSSPDSDFETDAHDDIGGGNGSDADDHFNNQTSLKKVGRSHWDSSSDSDNSSTESSDDSDTDDDSSESSERYSDSDSVGYEEFKKKTAPPAWPRKIAKDSIKERPHAPQPSQVTKDAAQQDQTTPQDCDDPMQVDSEGLAIRRIKEESDENNEYNLDAVVVGAASTTWEAFLFYLHTGVLEFAPLSSTGGKKRTAYIKQALTPDRPRPCSPKSMYRLADIMKLDDLKQLCLNEIRDQLSVRNILTELLSTFTSK